MNIHISQLSRDEDTYISAIVDLQIKTFPNGVLCALGKPYMTNYIRSLLETPSGGIFVARSGNSVLGFIGYITDPADEPFHTAVASAKKKALWKLFTLRISPTILLRGLRKKRLSKELVGLPELLIFAVSESAQRLGVGSKLFHVFETYLQEMGCSSYCVYTDNVEGYNFYTKKNLSRVFEFTFLNTRSAGFRREFSHPREKVSQDET